MDPMEIEGYQVFERIGTGATSEVYRAFNLKSQQEVALKCFSQIVTSDEDMLKRLAIESKTLENLEDPNIVKLNRTFEDENSWGLELEFVDGRSLDEWAQITHLKVFEPKLWILAHILKALSHAHSQGIIHRDLKPENVLISNSGDVKLTDFGLAKTLTSATITKSGLLIGSLAYMPPEVLDLSQATKKSDLYSFGIIAYELLAGKLPFNSQSPQSLIREITTETPTPLDQVKGEIPKSISKLIMSCMDRDPEKRPKSCHHVYADIMDYLTEKTDPISKKLISIPLETSLFHEFLERKHEKLKSELNQDQSLENLMQIHNQLNLLYPESELLLLTQQKIATLSQDESNPKRKYVLLFLLSISLMGSATLWWISQPEKTKLVSKAAITKPVTKATVETPKVVSKKVTPKKIVPVAPRVKYGFINFELPPGVKVYVDNILVPERSLHKYKLKAGKHKVRFEKEGFDPINGSVDVKANNTSIVRIGGA